MTELHCPNEQHISSQVSPYVLDTLWQMFSKIQKRCWNDVVVPDIKESDGHVT